MKKKIFALITAVALVAILCLSLVACNKDDNEVGMFSDDMSKEEIVEEVEKIENFTIEIYAKSGGTYGTTYYYFGKDFFNAESDEHFESDGISTDYKMKRWQFVDGTRQYAFSKSKTDSQDWEIGESTIIDYTGCGDDVLQESNEMLDIRNGYIAEIMEMVQSGEYSIKNGNLTFGDESATYTVKNINKTEKLPLDDDFKDYKNMPATESAVEYELSLGIYYILDRIDDYVTAYEVLATYNDKPVIEFGENGDNQCLRTLILPTSIVKMNSYCAHTADMGELHIIYKGTKAQWSEVENHSVWSADKGIRVTCTDGDYVETTTEA